MKSLPPIEVEDGDRPARFHGSWYRGPHTNFIPSKATLASDEGLRRALLDAWRPEKPFLTREHRILAFGSCFAQHISTHLRSRGYAVLGRGLNLQSHIIRFGEGMVNTFAILQQLRWALEGAELPDGLWFGPDKEIAPVDPAVRDETAALIRGADVFVLTLGLSEIWYDKVSGEAFWRAIPAERFDPERHGFRVSTVEENAANLREIRRIIRTARPEARIVFTLSPIPLMATFRDMPCISANTVSKAVLRLALDAVFSETPSTEGVHYFPSYELVKEVFADPFGEDNRHVRPELLERVMGYFVSDYCVPEAD